MVYIPGDSFMMGADNNQADTDEYSKQEVKVKTCWINKTEVTNAAFQKFVTATGYIINAENKPDWKELKKTLPPGTPESAFLLRGYLLIPDLVL